MHVHFKGERTILKKRLNTQKRVTLPPLAGLDIPRVKKTDKLFLFTKYPDIDANAQSDTRNKYTIHILVVYV